MTPDQGPEVVRRYFERLVAHDWAGLAAYLDPAVVRVGPFGDTYTPREPYVAFLAGLMPTLEGYTLQVDRLVAAGGAVVAQLAETMVVGGSVVATREALVFDVGPDGLITRIDIFIQRAGPPAGAA